MTRLVIFVYYRLQNQLKEKRQELRIMRMETTAMMRTVQKQRMRMTKTSLDRLRTIMLRIRMMMVMLRERKLTWMRTLLQRRMTCDGNRSVMNKQ